MSEEIKFPIRINRYLELQGVATRKGADVLIEQGLVWVNGQKAVLGYKVRKGDRVEVSPVASGGRKKFVYFAYHKPRGLATEDIKNKLPVSAGDVFPLGRLDKESEGLILLTNDGRVTDRLLNPKYAHEKIYEVEVREKVSPMHKKILEGGVTYHEANPHGLYRQTKSLKLKAKGVEILDSHRLAITLTEGKKHEIRRMLAGAHLTVVSLKRVQIMNIKLGSLASSKTRELKGQELKEFLAMLY
ncbi:MAG: pseudouridine synthase [Candidatus Paceibacterota bacterium]|jgi:23S rRNA pseudouridine2604 synthase